MNRRSGFTFVELLFAIVVLVLLASILAFVAAPALADGMKQACAKNLKHIGTAIRQYMADNDGSFSDWKSREMGPYLGMPRAQLRCPKATSVSRSGMLIGSFRDLIGIHAAHLNTPSQVVTRKLANGMVAPEFDIERDAVIKCLVHGTDGYVDPPSSGILMVTETNIRARIQSLYSDTHVAMAHPVACWEVPYNQNELVYKQHPELLSVCDGTMEKTSN